MKEKKGEKARAREEEGGKGKGEREEGGPYPEQERILAKSLHGLDQEAQERERPDGWIFCYYFLKTLVLPFPPPFPPSPSAPSSPSFFLHPSSLLTPSILAPNGFL
jgi:hypothetical protein